MDKFLEWTLAVATYNRSTILEKMLLMAANQTYPPAEVVVVDASDKQSEQVKNLIDKYSVQFQDIRWIYYFMETPSIACQRNKAIAISTKPIIFFFDDDTLMYPDCAQKIMELYAKDNECLIAGMQALHVQELPENVNISEPKKKTCLHSKMNLSLEKWGSFIKKKILLMDVKELFIPYLGYYPKKTCPNFVISEGAFATPLLSGYAMTFRRKWLNLESFNSSFLYYSPGEDLDLSYRISQYGCLVCIPQAKVHHYEIKAGRTSRRFAIALSITNQALCLRLYGKDISKLKRIFYFLMCKRLLAEFLKDLLSARWTFPQFRGILDGLRWISSIFTLPEERLKEEYIHIQEVLKEQSKKFQ